MDAAKTKPGWMKQVALTVEQRQALTALQLNLKSQGYEVDVTGKMDEKTLKALARLKADLEAFDAKIRGDIYMGSPATTLPAPNSSKAEKKAPNLFQRLMGWGR